MMDPDIHASYPVWHSGFLFVHSWLQILHNLDLVSENVPLLCTHWFSPRNSFGFTGGICNDPNYVLQSSLGRWSAN